MDFSQIKKWMQKMDNILELYQKDESFTQAEKNLLLDYNKRIEESIKAISVEEYLKPKQENEKPLITPFAKETVELTTPTTKSDGNNSNPPSENITIPMSNTEQYMELFQFKKIADLSEKLDSNPIENIVKALGLNARILAQNDLFKGDKNSFDSTIQKLEAMTHFEEAKNYLCEQIIPQYDWTHEDRLKKAQDFIKLIKRKYK